jgi:hypothetical protein
MAALAPCVPPLTIWSHLMSALLAHAELLASSAESAQLEAVALAAGLKSQGALAAFGSARQVSMQMHCSKPGA